MPPKKKSKLSLDSFATPIKVIVGTAESKKEFYIRKDLICTRSEFFKAACNPQWECGKTNTINLEEDNATIFGIFLTWATTCDLEDAADLFEVPEKTKNNKKERQDVMDQRHEQLLHCFSLGDSLQAPAFQNAIMDSVILLAKEYIEEYKSLLGSSPEMIREAFDNTPKSSPVRKFLLDQFISTVNVEPWMETLPADLQHPNLEFIRELLHASLSTCRRIKTEGGDLQDPWEKDRCYYHLHPDQPAGYKCTSTQRKVPHRSM